jgi:cell division protein FtsQ
MARRAALATADAIALPAPKRARSALTRTLKQLLMAMLMVAGLILAVWGYVSVESFIVSDERFRLTRVPEPGQKVDAFRIEGAQNVTDEQVIEVFARDFGRSVFLCPLKERRLKLMGIDWVKDASISRLWPNRLVIRLTERKPQAFAQLAAADGTLLLWLIDSDGVLLDPKRARPFHLPVLTGMTRSEGEASRAARMKRFVRLQAELGTYMDTISEIDVSDVDNVKVIQQFDGRAVALILGNQKYRERYELFLNNFDEIRKRLPDAVMLDLRFKDSITAVAAPPPKQQPAKLAGAAR